jgi:hypothetical protein
MVTKPGLAENAGKRFSSGSALENFERRWRQNNPARQAPGRKINQHLIADGRAARLCQEGHPWPALAGPRKDCGMYIQYVGFTVAASSRTYNFDAIDTKETREFTVRVQSEAFRPARLKLQDGPGICFARLKQELQGETLESRTEAHLNIGERDVLEYVERTTRASLSRRKQHRISDRRAE